MGDFSIYLIANILQVRWRDQRQIERNLCSISINQKRRSGSTLLSIEIPYLERCGADETRPSGTRPKLTRSHSLEAVRKVLPVHVSSNVRAAMFELR